MGVERRTILKLILMTKWERVDRINLAEDRDQLPEIVKMALNSLVAYKVKNVLISLATTSFSRRTGLQEVIKAYTRGFSLI